MMTAVGLFIALRVRQAPVLIIALGVALRVLVAVAVGPIGYPPGSDSYGYAAIALNIASGHGIVLGPNAMAIYPPLYPILLSGLGATVLNIAVDVGIAATLFVLGREMDLNGRIAAALYMFWPVAALQVTTPQKDTLAVLLGLHIGLAALRLGRQWGWREAVRLGVCAGLMGLAQPAFAPFAGIAALIMAPKKAVRIAAWSLPVAALILLPWWIRNWTVFHAFVPFTTAFGYNLVVAVTGYYAPLKAFQGMPELAGSQAAARAALAYAMQHPAHVLYLRLAMPLKAALFERSVGIVLHPLMAALQVYWLGLLAGGAAGLRKAPRELLLLIAACLVQFALFNFWFEFGERHRYLIVPWIMLLCAAAAKGKTPAEK